MWNEEEEEEEEEKAKLDDMDIELGFLEPVLYGAFDGVDQHTTQSVPKG